MSKRNQAKKIEMRYINRDTLKIVVIKYHIINFINVQI